MKDKSILISVGIIPNVIYIPVAILGIALILVGFFKDKSK